ncbi:MAG: tryptophan synthase subunit alpha [Polyangiaceae bacterium]
MTLGRLEHCFAACRHQGRPALVIYLTIGDPSVEDSLACARAALDAGADILELGVPFSDPTADGPTIAAASRRAIAGGGSLRAALSVAERLRAETKAPLVLFTYMNPVMAFGEARLPAAAAAAGLDALLLVDLPPEEGEALRSAARAADVGLVPLIAPTSSPARAGLLLGAARGFAYYVSLTGVTGTADAPLATAATAAKELAARHGLPVVVGFGVDSAEKAAQLAAAGVDGVVVGSAVVRAIAAANSRETRVSATHELVAGLRAALG